MGSEQSIPQFICSSESCPKPPTCRGSIVLGSYYLFSEANGTRSPKSCFTNNFNIVSPRIPHTKHFENTWRENKPANVNANGKVSRARSTRSLLFWDGFLKARFPGLVKCFISIYDAIRLGPFVWFPNLQCRRFGSGESVSYSETNWQESFALKDPGSEAGFCILWLLNI